MCPAVTLHTGLSYPPVLGRFFGAGLLNNTTTDWHLLTSEMGQKRSSRPANPTSAVPPESRHYAAGSACPFRAKPGNREKSNLPGKSCTIEAIQKVLHVFLANKNRIFATIHTCNKTWREAVEHRDFGLGTRNVASPSAACDH
jgi:hypothetical protein